MRVSTWLAALGAALAVVAGQAALAQTATPAQSSTHLNSQQEKMKTCNADAKTKGLTGDARKAFMKSCLSSSG